MMELADEIIELGTDAGADGGKIVFQGSLSELKKADTYTANLWRSIHSRKAGKKHLKSRVRHYIT